MRIAIFTETFLPKVDGIVNTICYLLRYLADNGHQSLLFAPSGGPKRFANTPIVGFRGYPFPPYPELKLVPPFVPIAKQLRDFQPDLVHIVNPLTLGVVGIRQARRLDVPIAASYHTDIPGFMTQWGWQILANPTWRLLRYMHNQADLNLCPSSATKAELDAHGFHNVQVWSRGVDADQFHPRHRTRRWRLRLTNGNSNRPVLLFVGRLSPEKRIDWLLPLKRALPQVQLAIVGDGPARAQLQQDFAGTGTIFTGYLRGQELAQAYASADMFVFPAANETFGNVVLEAMASGLPVVAAGAGGPLDFVVDGVTGSLFDPDDPQALLTAVQQLVNNPHQAKSMGEAGRHIAEKRSWSQVMAGLVAAYGTLIHPATHHQPLPAKQAPTFESRPLQ